MPSQVFDKAWVSIKRSARIKGKARVHDIRHTFATKTARDKWPIPHATKILDMSADVYMATYVHITTDDIREYLDSSFG